MFDTLLERIALALDEHAVPYMVIGGQAVLLYGEPRLTRDIDITLGAALDRLDDVLAAARAADLEPLVDPQTFTRQTFVLPCRDSQSEIRVDFILSFLPYERQAIAHAQTVRIGSASVRFVTREDLIVHKLIAGRPRDLEDIKSILLKRPTLDLPYIRSWLEQFAEVTEQPLGEHFERLLDESR